MVVVVKVCQIRFDSLEGLRFMEDDTTEVLVPLTNSLYVPGKVVNTGKVIVDVGTGYYVEKVHLKSPFPPVFEALFSRSNANPHADRQHQKRNRTTPQRSPSSSQTSMHVRRLYRRNRIT